MINHSTTSRYYFNKIEKCNMCGEEKNVHILGQRLNKSQGLRPKKKIGVSVSIIQCENCNLIYSNPQPVPFDIQDHYGIPPEDYWTAQYFDYNPDYFNSQIKKAKELLNFVDGMSALDIGAGLGKCMLSLGHAGFDTYGFEPSIPFRNKAIEKMKINSERIKLGMIENVDYAENSFDFITFGAVLEHLYDPNQSIINALKWLKPNGIIHIEVPSSKYLISKIMNAYYKLIGSNYVTNLSPMHEPFHLYEFDIQSFQKHAEKNNYKIVFYEYFVCNIYFIPKIFHPVLKWYMKKTNKGMQLSIWLQKIK